MKILVLGSSAGGGFPQWNCYCSNCKAVRHHDEHYLPRSQSSIAVSENGKDWILINASPDIRYQLLQNKCLQISDATRGSAIKGIVLVDSQIDHTSGLIQLREGNALPVYCTHEVYEDLTVNYPLLSVLNHYCGYQHHKIIPNQSFKIDSFDLSFLPIPILSNAPPYSPHRDQPEDGDNIALLIQNSQQKTLFYAPGCGNIDETIINAMQQADCLLVDGTCWDDDELIQLGLGHQTASQMGHLALSGPNGMLALLKKCPKARKVLIHINNSNPILNQASPEFKQLQEQEIEMAYDGLLIDLDEISTNNK